MKSKKDFYSNLPDIQTDRLSLRKARKEDLEDIFEYASNDNVARYLQWDTHLNIDVTRQYLNDVLKEYSEGKDGPWMIVYKPDKKVVGAIHIITYDERNSTVEIGYVLSEKYWNRGIITEALKSVIAHCIDELRVNRIQLRCKSENTASERVMRKCGLKIEGEMRDAVYEKGRYWNFRFFSVLKSEYTG